MSLYNSARDLAQRSFGCLGLSILAHVGALVVLIFAPHGRMETPASAQGVSTIELANTATKGAPRETTHEVMLASSEDVNAVAVPVPAPPPPVARPPVVKSALRQAAPKVLVQKESEIAQVPDEEFQPSAVADTEEKNQDTPEELSPVISEEPLVPPPSSDSLAEKSEAPPVAEPPARLAEAPPLATSTAAGATTAASAPAAAVAAAPVGQPNGMIVAPGSAVNGTPTGKSGYGAGPGQIVDASLRKPISGPLPRYSQQDRLLRREGLAVVVARVHTDGSVDGVAIERSSGSRDMDQAAIESFKQWKFVPGPEASVRKSFQFSLRGEAQVGYAKLKQ